MNIVISEAEHMRILRIFAGVYCRGGRRTGVEPL